MKVKDIKPERVILIVLAVIILLISLSNFLRYQEKQKKLNENYKRVSEITSEYIREKYGFNAQFIDTEYASDLENFGEPGSCVYVHMKYGDTDFGVVTYMNEEKPCCSDNYQYGIISQAAEEYIDGLLPGGKIIEINYYKTYYKTNLYSSLYPLNVAEEYFDGSNITEFLSSYNVRLEMVFADTVFTREYIEKLPGNFEAELTSFDTEEHRDEFFYKIKAYDKRAFYKYNDYQKYAPHITDHFSNLNDEVTRLDIKLLETEEFTYAYFPAEQRSYAKSEDRIKAEVSHDNTLYQIYKKHNEEKWISRPVSKEYCFDSIYGDIWIYYPVDSLGEYTCEDIGLAWFSKGGMSNNRDISKAEICGDYAVFNIQFGEAHFMLTDISGMEEYVRGMYDEK
ncbi:MAG: hypothetical protein IJ446_10060 [Oscillospiraceae bacterium]|nr:hypothetical protein [Oscillospiraceae bacterium]